MQPMVTHVAGGCTTGLEVERALSRTCHAPADSLSSQRQLNRDPLWLSSPPRDPLPCHSHVGRILIDPNELEALKGTCGACRAAATERIEDDVALARLAAN